MVELTFYSLFPFPSPHKPYEFAAYRRLKGNEWRTRRIGLVNGEAEHEYALVT